MSFDLRLLTPRDFPSVDALLTAAYSRSTSMLDDLIHYYWLQPDGWLLALKNERPVGMGGCLFYGTVARIGLMAVLPEMQHQGIGAAILQQLLAWVANRGATTVFLDATPAGAPLYARFGFVTDDCSCAYIQRRSSPLVSPALRTTRRLGPDELPDLVSYDTTRFGTQRTRVLTSYSEKCASRIFVARDSQGSMTGYIIAQPSRLGPWLADTPEIAEALLQQALHLSFAQSFMVITSKSNQTAQLLLKQAGFLPERCWQSMRLGGMADLRGRQWLYGYANLYVG
jgi:GNAT superfamily N-acetyltransferase